MLRQNTNCGIANYMSKVQNSYTRYFNVRHQRRGQLFLNQFKAVLIENDVQLHHVVRYIHLNPFTSFVVKNMDQLNAYPYSSLPEYLSKSHGQICDKTIALRSFLKPENYLEYLSDQADYQRSLDIIKHLLNEKETICYS